MHRLNFIKASIIVIIISMLSFYFCDKSEISQPSGTSGNTSQYLTNTYLQQSRWSVTQLVKNKQDVTGHFNGYVLRFYNGGQTVAVKNNGAEIRGQWSTNHTNDENILVLDYGDDTTFVNMNNTWQVTELLVNRIRLQAVSRGHIGTDNLTLESINVQP